MPASMRQASSLTRYLPIRPYTCNVSADGTGQNFVQMTVTKNVPGVFSLSTATAQDFPLVARMFPPGTPYPDPAERSPGPCRAPRGYNLHGRSERIGLPRALPQ